MQLTPRYVVGDATQPQGSGTKIIVHICNDVGGWGAGFVLALSKRWREPEAEYRGWHRDKSAGDFALGSLQLVQVQPDIFVANLIGQRDVRPRAGQPPIRYEAVRTGLARLREQALTLSASIHMPRIGCGLAGGRWDAIEPLVIEELLRYGIDVTVYDLR
jgi:O-acetyl-ADP-ribose deacetylase (regulator of RNase III)